jgi:acylglycerol lipase
MPHTEANFTARDGLRLFEQSWLPEAEPRAGVVLVPGFAEHSGRHAWTAEQLSRRGYAVHAMDLRGHGRSAGPRCFIRSFDQYLDDLDVFLTLVRQRLSGKPLILFGHSLGGLIAVRWCQTRGAANISPLPQAGEGPGVRASDSPRPLGEGLGVRADGNRRSSPTRPHPNPLPEGEGTGVAALLLSAPALRIRDDQFPWLRRLAGMIGTVFPGLRIVHTRFLKVSRDPAVVAQAEADPLVFHGRFPVRTGAEILRAMQTAREGLESLWLPLLILQGTADRVTMMEGSQELYTRAGSSDKTLRLYEGLYHEVLQEPEREQVLADLIAWLKER